MDEATPLGRVRRGALGGRRELALQELAELGTVLELGKASPEQRPRTLGVIELGGLVVVVLVAVVMVVTMTVLVAVLVRVGGFVLQR